MPRDDQVRFHHPCCMLQELVRLSCQFSSCGLLKGGNILHNLHSPDYSNEAPLQGQQPGNKHVNSGRCNPLGMQDIKSSDHNYFSL